MRSSGIDNSSIVIDVFCGDEDDNGQVCVFEGTVDAWVNPETEEWGWTCPDCGYEHEDEYEPEDGLDYEGDDYWEDDDDEDS